MRPAARRVLFAREIPRATGEYAGFVAARRRLRRLPKGDGHPTLVLPGFMGSDISTRALRRLLRELGYDTHAWRLGRNWGPTDQIIDGLRDRVSGLLADHGRPLTLIGHSLGGIYAREIARAAPQAVRQVITLGSPARRPESGTSTIAPVFQALSPMHSDRAKQADPARISEPIGVPLTAIVTKSDGVVPWRTCLVQGEQTECIEVRGSHSGLIHNPEAIGVIADRLSQPEGTWAPFRERRGITARRLA